MSVDAPAQRQPWRHSAVVAAAAVWLWHVHRSRGIGKVELQQIVAAAVAETVAVVTATAAAGVAAADSAPDIVYNDSDELLPVTSSGRDSPVRRHVARMPTSWSLSSRWPPLHAPPTAGAAAG